MRFIHNATIGLTALTGLASCDVALNPYDSPPNCSADDMIGTLILDRANAYDKVSSCLASGANPDGIGTEGTPILTWVARYNDGHIAALMLQHGADPNLMDAQGLTPLFATITPCNTEVGNMLIDAGGSLNVLSPTNQQAAIDAIGVTCEHGSSADQNFGKRVRATL